jgi:hypothetical protein
MILLWGLPNERPLAAVWKALERRGVAAMMLDQRLVLSTQVELCVGSSVEGFIRITHSVVDLCTVTAAYLRPYDTRILPQIAKAGPHSSEWRHAVAVEDILTSWSELTSGLVVNRPSAAASNSSKPYQGLLIESAGFRTPETLTTTDPDAALQFGKKHGTIIYKSLSGVRSIVSKLGIEHERRLQDVRWCPTQFQQYISGTDYRIHVVDDEVFACVVESEAVDYRYPAPGQLVRIHGCNLPEDIAARCSQLAASLGLKVAGIDLRRSPADEWYCFEVNPSPGFTYFQEQTGQPIDEAIARLLGEGRSP